MSGPVNTPPVLSVLVAGRAYPTVMTVMDNLYRMGWRADTGTAGADGTDGTERALRIGILTGFSRP
jgi:hypothetical protein